MRQSVKKKDRYADAPHCRVPRMLAHRLPTPLHVTLSHPRLAYANSPPTVSPNDFSSVTPRGARLTQSSARNTSVTLNLLSTLHGASFSPSSITSPTNVSRQRRPHHAAGSVLSPRHSSSGMCQCVLTPRRTATERWRTDRRLPWTGSAGAVGPVGDGLEALEAGRAAAARWELRGDGLRRSSGCGGRDGGNRVRRGARGLEATACAAALQFSVFLRGSQRGVLQCAGGWCLCGMPSVLY